MSEKSTTMTAGSNPLLLRRAQRADFPSLFRLIVALAEFEKLTPPDAGARDRLLEDGFGDQPRYEVWLAFWASEPEPVGYAFLFETYSSFLARPTLYLEDIFVLPEFRGKGIGAGLLRHCVGLAYARECGRMEWTVLDWNTKAQQFYDSIGADHKSEWFLYRLTRDKMGAYLERTRRPLPHDLGTLASRRLLPPDSPPV